MKLKSVSKLSSLEFNIDRLSADTAYIELSYEKESSLSSYKLFTKDMFQWFISYQNSAGNDFLDKLKDMSCWILNKLTKDLQKQKDDDAETYVTLHGSDTITGDKTFDANVDFNAITRIEGSKFTVKKACSPIIKSQLTCTNGIDCSKKDAKSIFTELECLANPTELSARCTVWQGANVE